jgi:beta-xylosidase
MILIPVAAGRLGGNPPLSISVSAQNTSCDPLGWDPAGFGLKDHTVFWFDGFYYISSIRIPDETGFAYARSTDLCNWDDLGTIIDKRIPSEWDEKVVWAPFVWEENGVFNMYYTGVTRKYTQSIMLATSTNPADPDSWQRQGVVFQPDHEGSIWQVGGWADCRDASVIKVGEIYFMYYTGRDITGPIIGWATSFSPSGPWHDWGATLALAQQDIMVESPTIINHAGTFFLLYNNTFRGEEYRIGFTQIGPWSKAFPFQPGWANEIWVGQDGLEYTSYVKNYAIGINPVKLDDYYNARRSYIEANIHWLFIPILLNP